MWTQSKMSDYDAVVTSNDDVTIGFFRHTDNSAWVFIITESGHKFDMNRPPVYWIDDGEKFDLAIMKNLQETMDGLDGDDHPVYSDDDDVIFARVWHGDASEGYGQIMPSLVQGRNLTLQVYADSYDVIRYQFELDAGELFKSVLRLSL